MSRPLLSRCTCILRTPSNSRASSSSPRQAPTNPQRVASSSPRSEALRTVRTHQRLAPDDPSTSYPSSDSRRYGPRLRTSTAPEAADSWRSRAHSTPKRTYLEAGAQPEIKPRIGQALKDYQRLPSEARRREDVARERLMRELSPNKLYAMEREKERIVNSKLEGKDPADIAKLHWAAKTVMPGRKQASMAEDGQRHASGRGVGKLLKTAEYHAKLVPGSVNRGTRATTVDRNVVKPVVRGGAAKNANRPRARPKVLRKVVLPSTVRLENLTNILGVRLWTLQKTMERIGMDNTRPERLLTADDASMIALELNFDPTIDDDAAFDIYPSPPALNADVLPLRPPVTGIFGHVDHGKTSLLDALRSTSVASGEAGGITQHIGAFEVSVATIIANLRAKDKKNVSPAPAQTDDGAGTITFLDTPGHAAFTAMRERGAGVTDVVVLVVAADDGVKPQTEEVIGLVKSADFRSAQLKVKQSLMAAGVEVEAFGGDVPCVEVSSMTGQGLPELLETISAIAEVRELKAERDGRVEGRVLESRVEKGRGNVATVLVLRGCLKKTASLVAGTTWCRVRTLVPPTGKDIISAFPGQPVEVTGWKDLPSAGDLVLEATTEDEAKKAVSNRLRRVEQDKLWQDVEIINEKRRVDSEIEEVRKREEAKAKASGLTGNAITMAGNVAVDGLEASVDDVKELVLVIKADVSGTVEAVVGALQGIGNKEARVKIVSAAVGDVQESDVEMARAIGGCIVGFNVKAPNAVLKLASRPPTPVPVHTSPIIYRLVEIVRAAVADLLPRTIETRVHGEALVQQLFEIAVKGRKDPMKVAGCKVSNGVFQKGRKARVMRNGEVVHTGTVSTLKQVKKDVLEITKGVECGIALDDFDSFETLDIIQSVEEIEHKAIL
ncbi:translation initiation factor IF-2, partial [Phenoliferia sp. Uapishka_3]